MTDVYENESAAFVRALVAIPTRAKRNPQFVRGLRKMVFPRKPNDRKEALREFQVWLLQKNIAGETEEAKQSIKGFAAALLDGHPEIVEHAQRVDHLGALAPLAVLPATRWDYASLVLHTLLLMKQQQPGLGLGSGNFNLRFGNSALSGLEIAQTWALLGGYGHLFGTFATERALLFALDEAPAYEQEFLTQLAPDVRQAAEIIIRQRDIYRFFYVLAAWRVSRWPACASRTCCLQVLTPILEQRQEGPWKRLLWAFRRARQIAYTRLHAMLGFEIASNPIDISVAVRDLRPLSQIGFLDEESEPPGAVVGLIQALDQFYGDAFFTSPRASQAVLAHLREFKSWWKTAAGPVEDRLENLFEKPRDWPTSTPVTRRHFARLHVPDRGIGWTSEVRQWLAPSDDVWSAGNFLITPRRAARDECNVVDVFIEQSPHPKLVAHVARLLAERNEATWSAPQPTTASRLLWRSIAGFGLHVFQQLLKPGRLGHLEPVPADGGIGLAIAARTVESGCGRLADFARRVRDASRRVELDALREACMRHRHHSGTWFAFLGRVRILDRESGRQLQELDGVYALIEDAGVEWHFIEHKDGDSSGMRGQLDELSTHLITAAPQCEPINVARGRAAHSLVTWTGAN